MLSIKNISAGYGNITVLNDVTFKLDKKKIIGVLGRNGMGKSTLIRVLSGLIIPTNGIIELNGENITNYAPHVRAQKRITTIVQGRGIFPKLSVYENLLMGTICQKRKTNIRLDEIYTYFPIISNRLQQTAGTLSGGEQQRIAIARALVNKPKIILADEPTGNLDPNISNEILDLLEMFTSNGSAVLMSTHNFPLIKPRNKKFIELSKGRMV